MGTGDDGYRCGSWPNRVFAVDMALWSAFRGFTAAASGFASLLAVRIVFGFG